MWWRRKLSALYGKLFASLTGSVIDGDWNSVALYDNDKGGVNCLRRRAGRLLQLTIGGHATGSGCCSGVEGQATGQARRAIDWAK